MRLDDREQERHRLIREALTRQPFATVKDLLDVVEASPATIRRDIAKLSEAGLIRKVFGGIALPDHPSAQHRYARPFEQNRVLNVDAKRAIAERAAALCRDGDTLIVNGGTTCFLFAGLLAKRSVKIYTNSMPVAGALWESGTCHLTVAGGDVYREPGIIWSPSAPQPDFYASKFFLGAQGIGPAGVLESNPLVVRVVGGLVERADEVVVLADSTKFDIRARLAAIALARISTLITDDRVSAAHVDMLRNEGVEVIVASATAAQAQQD